MALGLGMTVGRLIQSMSAGEFLHWQAYHAAEPFGPVQDDYRAAVGAIVPATAMSGQRIDPAKLFPSLAEMPDQAAERRKRERKNIGRGFRLWARANSPALTAIGPDQKTAR